MQFDLKKAIVFEDNDVLIMNKPAGIVVHPGIANLHKSGTNNTNDLTLVDFVIKEYPEIKNVGQPLRPGIVHRLDKDTSGLIIVAKNQKSYDYLIDLFIDHQIEKRYYALVYGIMKERQGIITYSLEKKGKVRARLSKTSKTAITRYNVVEEFGNKFTLLNVKIETGRTHQIRVHLTKIGHPIVGDQEYKFRKMPETELKRQFLHAYFLKFKLPSGERKTIKIDLPEDLNDFLSRLK